MAVPIQLRRNGTAAATPSSLLHGEIALNYADGKVFWKDASNVIQSFTFQAYALSSHTHAASDITSGTFDAARIANDSITYAKLQNVSATDRLLGRSSAGAGVVEEITCTSFARSILDDASAADVRSTLSVQPTASPVFTSNARVSAGNVIIDGVGNFQVFTTDTQAIDKGGQIGLGGANGFGGGFDPWAFGVIKGAKENGTSGNFSGYLAFATAGSGGPIGERMRITSTGNVGIGTSSPDTKLDCRGVIQALGTDATTELLVAHGNGAFTNEAAIALRRSAVNMGKISANYFTGMKLYVTDGAGGAATERIGISTSGVVNIVGGGSASAPILTSTVGTSDTGLWFPSADVVAVSTAGTERVRVDAGGNALINTTSGDPAGTNQTSGCCISPSSYISITRSAAPCLYVNRKTDDGTIVSIHQDGTAEGSISVAGNTVSYNAFCGSHWAQLIDGSRPCILRGTVLEAIDEMCEWPEGKSDRLARVQVSATPASRRVYGVFMAWDEEYAATGDLYAAALGAYMVRVSGVVQSGDLLESAGDGTARAQSDDLVRSSTIGKVSSTHRVAEYDDGSYLVPCVLMCG
jgi:hypothetical protein